MPESRLFQIKHSITGAVLFQLECGSLKLCVEAAVTARANLADAYLARANLAINLGHPNGWHAFAWLKDGEIRVQVGCRNFSLAEGRAYWSGKDNRREVLAALDYAETVAELRGWEVKREQKEAA